MEVSGYFRAPVAMGLSSRPGPDNWRSLQHAGVVRPNRTVDAELFQLRLHATARARLGGGLQSTQRRSMFDARSGDGYWFQSVGFRNRMQHGTGPWPISRSTRTSLLPTQRTFAHGGGLFGRALGISRSTTPSCSGAFAKIGEQLKLTVPLPSGLTVSVVQSFGTGRDGSFNYLAPPFYGAITGLDLLTWAKRQLTYRSTGRRTPLQHPVDGRPQLGSSNHARTMKVYARRRPI